MFIWLARIRNGSKSQPKSWLVANLRRRACSDSNSSEVSAPARIVAVAEDGPVLLLDLLEEREDPLLDLLAARIGELLLGPGPEPAPVAGRSLIVHLAENQVEKLPEGGVLRHALVAVDEVVAPTER